VPPGEFFPQTKELFFRKNKIEAQKEINSSGRRDLKTLQIFEGTPRMVLRPVSSRAEGSACAIRVRAVSGTGAREPARRRASLRGYFRSR
jgi:hypothetical protein